MFPSASNVNRKYARIMNEYDCGCLIIADDASGYFIHACNKHNAAPDLLEACEAMVKIALGLSSDLTMSWTTIGKLNQVIEDTEAAIAKARGN